MTPQDFFSACCYVCGGLFLIAVTLALLAITLVGFVAAAGWLASTFKKMEEKSSSSGGVHLDAYGNPVRTIHFSTGQVGTVPAGEPYPSDGPFT